MIYGSDKDHPLQPLPPWHDSHHLYHCIISQHSRARGTGLTASLYPSIGYHSVKEGVFVMVSHKMFIFLHALLPGAECYEVLAGLWTFVSEELETERREHGKCKFVFECVQGTIYILCWWKSSNIGLQFKATSQFLSEGYRSQYRICYTSFPRNHLFSQPLDLYLAPVKSVKEGLHQWILLSLNTIKKIHQLKPKRIWEETAHFLIVPYSLKTFIKPGKRVYSHLELCPTYKKLKRKSKKAWRVCSNLVQQQTLNCSQIPVRINL